MVAVKMSWWLVVFLLVLVDAKPKVYDYEEDACEALKCVGEEYDCINGKCYCARGYMPNPFHNKCIKCPGYGEKCFGLCCSGSGNGTLTCWQGVCQPCYDSMGTWICREPLDHMLLISTTQIAMATALVLGIIATFMLLYKLCAATTLRPMGSPNFNSRLSIGSLQVYVDERLRDAPPRYSRTVPPGTTAIPATVYVNSGFIHDCSVPPPPPYTPPSPPKEESIQHPTLHI